MSTAPEAPPATRSAAAALQKLLDSIRQRIRTDKDSGIVSDANRDATETLNNPSNPLDLLLRLITVSLQTLDIVQKLPSLGQ